MFFRCLLVVVKILLKLTLFIVRRLVRKGDQNEAKMCDRRRVHVSRGRKLTSADDTNPEKSSLSHSSESSGIGSSIATSVGEYDSSSTMDDGVFGDDEELLQIQQINSFQKRLEKLRTENVGLRDRLCKHYQQLAMKSRRPGHRNSEQTTESRERLPAVTCWRRRGFNWVTETSDSEDGLSEGSRNTCRNLSVGDKLPTIPRRRSKKAVLQRSVDNIVKDKLWIRLIREQEENRRLQRYTNDVMSIVMEHNPDLLEKLYIA